MFNTNSNLVIHSKGQAVTTSLLVAGKFKKRHADAIRSIESLILANEKLRSLYVPGSYIDEQGKPRPMYIMNRDGFSLLVMGFTGRKALEFKLEYIEAFNAMESALKEKALHPGQLTPTECVVLTCKDKSGKEKQAYLYYGDDEWFDCPKGWFDREQIMQYLTRCIAERDKATIRYEAQIFHVREGKYIPLGIIFPEHDKTALKANPVENCKQAIKDYEESKVKMKDAAKVVAEM